MEPNRPLPPPSLAVIPGLVEGPFSAYLPLQPRVRKFRHNYSRHVVLFLLTFLTATFASAFGPLWIAAEDLIRSLWSPVLLDPDPFRLFTWTTFISGLWGSVPLLAILAAHEFGHYIACRVHNVDATLPYFLPAPIPLTGTVGAVIRIREAFPSKKALFDIGVAGPIAGFVALLPFLYLGLTFSELVPLRETGHALFFGEPLLFGAFAWLHFGPIPEGYTVLLHPMGFAAWWGMLATAINLLPFGQLDGGHIAYAALGRRAGYVSLATLGTVMVLTMYSPSWLMTSIMLLLMAVLLGVSHPRVVDEDRPLDPGRMALALVSVAMFVLCFTPVPILAF